MLINTYLPIQTAYNEKVNYAALNNGYLQRIKEEDSRLQNGVKYPYSNLYQNSMS